MDGCDVWCFNEEGVCAEEVRDKINRGEEVSVFVEVDVRIPKDSYRKRANVTISLVGEGGRFPT